MALEMRNPALGGRGARGIEQFPDRLDRVDTTRNRPGSRLRLVEVRNDDGHYVGLDASWIPLGTAAALVVSRLGRRS
jgi:hypothetical protein